MESIFATLHGLNIWSVSFRVLLSVLLGGFIGLERGHHGRAAGLRTHVLVCLGATVSALVGLYSVSVLGFNSDPLRVGAQVVSGVGFLGVGTIMIRNRNQVTGLTTAAGLWATACIGLAIGIGFYIVALLAFLAVMVTICILIYLERSSKKETYVCYLELHEVCDIKEMCLELQELTRNIEVIPAKSGIASHIGLEVQSESLSDHETVLRMAMENENVIIALPARD